MAGTSSVNEAEHPELVHWDNLEGQDEEGVGGMGGHVYTCGQFMLMFGEKHHNTVR